MSDICDAISAGCEVTAHERNISVKGWTGLGYVILALTTGAEAYLIGGGADGGMINFFGENQNLIVLLLVTRYSSYCKCFASFLIYSSAPYNNFLAFMITMYNNLALMEAGCEELVPFNWVINILAVAAGVLFGSSVASTIWSAIFGWMYTSVVSSNPVINYCKAVNNRGAV